MPSFTRATFVEMLAHMHAGYPLEACGLLVGRGDEVERFVPCTNVAESARVYTLDPREHLRVDRAAEDDGFEVIGVVHSHTHSEPYPSATDVAQAPDPGWHYVIVSLKRDSPDTRSYSIVGDAVTEQPVTVR